VEVEAMADQEIEISQKQEVTPEKGELTYEGVYFTPAVDIYETEKELVLLADLPGVEADGLEVDLKDDYLTIVGRTTSAQEEGESLLEEYRTGSYFRNFLVTDAVDQSAITASLADGVLKVTLPKAAKAIPRKIPITSG
jgi:HSP20 family protein